MLFRSILIHLEAGDNTIELRNPIASKMDSAATQYIAMGKELKRATKLYAEKHGVPEKPIVFSICEWGRNKPWRWGSEAGNLWRTTPDIQPNWASVPAMTLEAESPTRMTSIPDSSTILADE